MGCLGYNWIMAVYEDVKRALQDIMAPQLAEIRGEMRASIAELRADMDSRFAQVDSRFAEVRSEIAQLRAEMHQEISNLHTDLVRIEQVFSAQIQSVQVVERVARLEERLARA